MAKISRALISVSDKSGIVDFAKAISDFGVEIISTGGTAKLLRESGLEVKDISDFTGFPEMLDGRVKTLHPKVHGAILGKRDDEEHRDTMKKYQIQQIDMVIVNLYPFEKTTANPDCTLEDAIENIDIGGPAMIRSAAKNNCDVTVIVDNEDFPKILSELKNNEGAVSRNTNFRLAVKAYERTSEYDQTISTWLKTKIDTVD